MRYLLTILVFLSTCAFAQDAEKQWQRANTLKEQGIYDSAVYWFEKSAETYKSSGNTSKELDAINQAGFLYSLLGNPQKGMELLQPALERGLKIGNGKNEQVASSYHSIGVAYYVAGMYEEAIENTTKGYELRKEIFDGPHEDIAKSLNNLGILNENMGDLNKAFEIYNEAHQMQLKLYGERHVEVANSLNNLGANAYYRGDYDKALPLYTEALEMYKEFVGDDHKDVASVYLNIGTIYTEQGEFVKALEYSKLAESLYVKLYGKEDPNYLNVALNLSTIYKEMSDPQTALDYAQEGYDLAKMFYGEQHPVLAQLAQNIGVIHDDLNHLDKAIEWQKKSLDINLMALGESNLSVAYNYNNLGTAYERLGDLDLAETYTRKSLEVKTAVLGPRHVSVSNSWNNLSKIYFVQQKFDQSINAAHNGLMANHFNFSDSTLTSIPEIKDYSDPEVFVGNLIIKAVALMMTYLESNELSRLQNAREHVKVGLELLNRWQTSIGAEDKIHMAEEYHNLATAAITVYQTLYENTPDEVYLHELFEFIERTKGAVLEASIADAEAKKFAGIPDSLIAIEDSISTQISNASQELNLALNAGASEEEVSPIRTHLFKLKEAQREIITVFEKDYEKYHELKYSRTPVSLSKLQQEYLGKTSSAAIVEYFHSDSILYSLVITSESVKLIELGVSDYERNIRGLRNAIIYKIDDKIIDLASGLYTDLFAPIQEYLDSQNITELVIIPDGILGYLPFEVLVSKNDKKGRFEKTGFLINDYDIKYAVSSSIMYRQFKQPNKYGEKDYVAFAPVFADGTETNFLVNTHERFYNPDLENTRNFVNQGKITPIPATKREVERIHELHQQKNLFAKYFLFKDAKEENIKDPELSHYKFIHLATHGFVNDDIPELSGLVLSQEKDSEEDGILYVGEIYNLEWNADLVALSACETGLGKVVRGEGIIGLTRAFMYAGAENVLVSLWRVSDESTSDLMIDFYNHVLSDNNKATALRKAKLKLIQSGKYANPYYWAPFVIIGN